MGKYKWPTRWLAHYLLGSGQDLALPQELGGDIREACEGFSISDGGLITPPKPTWYMVGKMNVSIDRETISGVDRYDWHVDKDGEWAWINVPIVHLPRGKMRFFFGGNILINKSGEIKIRDSFWNLVGGKEFNTLVNIPRFRA
jgi:hypothetical protein